MRMFHLMEDPDHRAAQAAALLCAEEESEANKAAAKAKKKAQAKERKAKKKAAAHVTAAEEPERVTITESDYTIAQHSSSAQEAMQEETQSDAASDVFQSNSQLDAQAANALSGSQPSTYSNHEPHKGGRTIWCCPSYQ